MQSNNPVFRRSEAFNGQAAGQANAYGNQTYAGNGSSYAGYGDPATWGTGTPGAPTTQGTERRRPMTIDSVVQASAISFAAVLVAAAATWFLTPEITADMPSSQLSGIFAAMTIGSLAAFGLSMVNSFKRVVSPPLVLAYAALEGVFVGAMSKVFQAAFGNGVVPGAVIGTIAAFAGTLAAYKVLNIRVTDKFRRFVTAALFGFVGLVLLDFVLSFFGAQIGVNGFGGLGLLMSIVGLGLGILMLILDFDYVEQGVAAGLPESESWRAAFGLTVTIVWIYIELLRIMAILRGD